MCPVRSVTYVLGASGSRRINKTLEPQDSLKKAMATLNRRNATHRYLVITLIALVILTGVLTWLAFVAFRPTPPRSVTMAIDPEGSFSAVVAKRYRELLRRDGIELKLVPLAGAVESVARLQDPKSDVSIGIIPSGITDEQKSPELISLGTLYYE